MSGLVRSRHVALVGGALVTLFLGVTYAVHPVPERVLALVGAPRGLDRLGGLRIRYRPPAGQDLAALAERLSNRAPVRREGEILVLEIPGVAEDQGEQVRAMLVGGSLEMREALETDYARALATAAGDVVDATDRRPGSSRPAGVVALELDRWRPDEGGRVHDVYQLTAPTRELLATTIASAIDHGWRPAPHTELGFEPAQDRGQSYWRTYELSTDVVIDGSMIETARPADDPYTNRPIVMLDFTRDGASRFCDATEHLVGHKLAMVLGHTVRSAPILNSRICGGRVSITMGDIDPATELAERDALVAVLSQGAMPAGGTVEHLEWVRPSAWGGARWAGRLLLALGGGAVFGLLAAVVVGFARPRWRARAVRPAGRWPVRRLVVTALAPVALIGLAQLGLPGVDAYDLDGMTNAVSFSPIALGIVPILTSFALVELVALAVPRWRRLRHAPLGRIALGKAVAGLAIVIALVQGFFVARYLEALSHVISVNPGWALRIGVMSSLAAGTMLLAVVAGMIREHGLGNGYGVVITTSAVLAIAHRVLDGGAPVNAALGLALVIVLAAITTAVLRWRVGEPGAAELVVPSSGIAPLSDAGGLVVIVATLSAFGLGPLFGPLIDGVAKLAEHPWGLLVIVAVIAPVWSWVFARPALGAATATRARLSPATTATWARATVVSTAYVVVAAILGVLAGDAAIAVGGPLGVIVGTAVVLDMIADARAHRVALEPAWVLHQVQHASAVERVLGDAGIPCHLHAIHLRTLLAFFGPFAPVIVHVPTEHAVEARLALAGLLESGPGPAPVAH
jgi:hypothetical protein